MRCVVHPPGRGGQAVQDGGVDWARAESAPPNGAVRKTGRRLMTERSCEGPEKPNGAAVNSAM